MNGYTLENWEREEHSSSCVWRDTELRYGSGEEQAHVNGLCCHVG